MITNWEYWNEEAKRVNQSARDILRIQQTNQINTKSKRQVTIHISKYNIND